MKLIHISDTHGQHCHLVIPNGKIIAHTGDFTNRGTELQVDMFLNWYASLPHQHKLLIAGNHDFYAQHYPHEMKQKCHILGITYLCDSSATIEGIKFYGTPYVPIFYDWAFMESERLLTEIYANIPDDTQVLLTHGPALFCLDEVPRGNVGSSALADRLELLPQLTHHLCGHIHESRGKHRGRYLTSNASCVDKWYNPLPPQSMYIKPN